jgi:hypothetical protein
VESLGHPRALDRNRAAPDGIGFYRPVGILPNQPVCVTIALFEEAVLR